MKKIVIISFLVVAFGSCDKKSGGTTTEVNPALSISDVTQVEGASGITAFVFTVSLDPDFFKQLQ